MTSLEAARLYLEHSCRRGATDFRAAASKPHRRASVSRSTEQCRLTGRASDPAVLQGRCGRGFCSCCTGRCRVVTPPPHRGCVVFGCATSDQWATSSGTRAVGSVFASSTQCFRVGGNAKRPSGNPPSFPASPLPRPAGPVMSRGHGPLEPSQPWATHSSKSQSAPAGLIALGGLGGMSTPHPL